MTVAKKDTVHARVKRLRQALGLSQQQMADHLDISFNRWNNVERGLALGLDLGRLIRRKVPGVTLDWLYEGDLHYLSWELAQKLSGPPPDDKK